MAKEMGLDRAPIEFWKLVFLVPPNAKPSHTILIRPRFNHCLPLSGNRCLWPTGWFKWCFPIGQRYFPNPDTSKKVNNKKLPHKHQTWSDKCQKFDTIIIWVKRQILHLITFNKNQSSRPSYFRSFKGLLLMFHHLLQNSLLSLGEALPRQGPRLTWLQSASGLGNLTRLCKAPITSAALEESV